MCRASGRCRYARAARRCRHGSRWPRRSPVTATSALPGSWRRGRSRSRWSSSWRSSSTTSSTGNTSRPCGRSRNERTDGGCLDHGRRLPRLRKSTNQTMNAPIALFFDLFKLRIGLVIGFTALAGFVVTPGDAPAAWRAALLVVAVVVSSAAAGAFNQYVERDIDARMARTKRRPFVTGRLVHSRRWLAVIGLMCAGSVVVAALATNALAALYTFLGAFVYGVVYTVWLKRRTWLNIVVGGLAGSCAVLAGAAAIAPARLDAAPLWLAV